MVTRSIYENFNLQDLNIILMFKLLIHRVNLFTNFRLKQEIVHCDQRGSSLSRKL